MRFNSNISARRFVRIFCVVPAIAVFGVASAGQAQPFGLSVLSRLFKTHRPGASGPDGIGGPTQRSDNTISIENQLPGNPPSEWDIAGAGDPTIQGFATDISAAPGDTVHF